MSVARSTMQALLSATSTVPEPRMAPASASSPKASGVSSPAGGRKPPEGPPTMTALRLPVAATGGLDDLAQRRAHRHLHDARVRTAPLTWTSMVPGASWWPMAP